MSTVRLSTLFLALAGLCCLFAAFFTTSPQLEIFGVIALLPALVQAATQPETKPANN